MAQGFRLVEGAAASGEPQSVPPLPGLWLEGEPKTAEQLGLEHDEVVAIVTDLGLPIEEVSDAPEFDPASLDRTAGSVSGASAGSSPFVGRARSESEAPGLSAAELRERDAFDAEMRRSPPEASRIFETGTQAFPTSAADEPLTAAERALAGKTLPELRDLAAEAGVEAAGTRKIDFVRALALAGVAPEPEPEGSEV